MGISEFGKRKQELENESMLDGDFMLAIMLSRPVNCYMPFINSSLEFAKALPTDFSKEGELLFREAHEWADDVIIEDLNKIAKLSEFHCDANYDSAAPAAAGLSDVQEAHYKLLLARYENLFRALSPEDREVVRRINVERFGSPDPFMPRDFRKHQDILAAEFPDEYLAKYQETRETVLANRGRPFQKVTRQNGVTTERSSSYSSSTTYTQDVDSCVWPKAATLSIVPEGQLSGKSENQKNDH